MDIKKLLMYSAFALFTYFVAGCIDKKCKGTPVDDIPSMDARGSMAEYRNTCKQLNKDNLNYRLEAKQTDNGNDITLFLRADADSNKPVNVRYITCITEKIGGWYSGCMVDTVVHEIKGPFAKGRTIEDKVNLPAPRFKKDADEAYILPQAIIYSDSTRSKTLGKVGVIFPAKLNK